ncbi:hypothetical protein HPB51_020824 [Rhipicephalus microplus]|uniref:Uncharacterized protein n=1 Tax=Rhipicephalus microplus TaxID=6941 RepID=A0A9J6EBV5_RHIMP|nr:hypothetical protein HPB51_020824 [Rhipicephalus microplus]
MSSTEPLRKVRGTVRASVSRNITLLSGLLWDSDTKACEVNKQVTVLITREAQLCQFDKQIIDVTEDEAVDQEVKDPARYSEKIVYAIAEGQYFLFECKLFGHVCDTSYSALCYARHKSENYNRVDFHKITHDCAIVESMEKDITGCEDSWSKYESGFSASQAEGENSLIEVEGNNIALGVTACDSVEPSIQNSMLLATFGKDEETITFMEDAQQQTFHAVNWTRGEQPLEESGSTLELEQERRDKKRSSDCQS